MPSPKFFITAEVDNSGAFRQSCGAKDFLVSSGVAKLNRAVFMDDPIGNQQGSPGTAGYTWYGKRQVPCEFDAVQLVVGNNLTNTPTLRAVIAVSETAAVDTDANRFHPIVGGTAYNALDAQEQYGWKSVTWAGAATATFGANASRSQYARDFLTTDVIPLSSVPRADGGAGYLLMWRIFASVDSISWVPTSALVDPDPTTHGSLILQSSYRSVDGITSLASTPAAANNGSLMVAVILYCRGRAVSVIGVGDSITENDGIVTDKVSSWGQRAAQAMIANGTNMGWINAGCSGQNSATFLAQAKAQVTLYKPHVATYAAWTPNDLSVMTAAQVRGALQTMMGRAHDFIRHCRANGTHPVLLTGIPIKKYLTTAPLDQQRKDFNARVIALGASGVCSVLDIDAIISDGGSPSDIAVAYQIPAESAAGFVHPNDAGISAISVQFAALMKTLA